MKYNRPTWDERKKGKKGKREKGRREKILYPVTSALGPDPPEGEGRDLPTAAPPFPPPIPCLLQPSKKGPRVRRLGEDGKAQEKQAGCLRAEISI